MKRTLFQMTGPDKHTFLQNLVTNDITQSGLIYTAMLTPQGKYLADFFVLNSADDTLIIDSDTSVSDLLLKQFMMYKLRKHVDITPAPLYVHIGLNTRPDDGYADPRSDGMGWRAYRDYPQTDMPDSALITKARIEHLIPQTGDELTPQSYILEMGFERLHGVDFKKGCYVGQEVTARMKHKTHLRKGLARVRLSEPACANTPIMSAGKTIGTLTTVLGTDALAYVRYDQVCDDDMVAGSAQVYNLRTV